MELAESFARDLTSQKTLSTVTRAMTRSTAAAFNSYVDRVSITNPLGLHHVYEWGHNHDPEFRLWDLVSVGHGNTRDLFYQFRASTVPVLTGRNREEDDTRSNVHIFYWKAPVMEAGLPLVVSPSADKGVLVFPRGQGGYSGFNDQGSMTYQKKPVVVQHPGGSETKGSFLKTWETFWHAFANEIIVEDFVEKTYINLKREVPIMLSKISKSKPHTFIVQTVPRKRQKANAKAAVDRLLNGYLRAARTREALSGGRPTSGL